MTLYFEGLTQEAEIKSRYKELAKQYHPDRGGSLEIMKAINLQYEKVIKGAYQKAGKSITEIEELLKKDAELREKLDGIITLDGLLIELCGSWLWVTGDTRLHKDKLKELKFMWANTKKAWYFRNSEQKSYNRQAMSLDEIRGKHGSLNIQRKQHLQVA